MWPRNRGETVCVRDAPKRYTLPIVIDPLASRFPVAVSAMMCVLAFTLGACKRTPKIAPAAEREIRSLLDAFEKSGLQFERNSKIIPNADASKWLRQKWERRRRHILSTENFIDHVADHSSETKQPYVLVAPDGKRIQSSSWFREQLGRLRTHP